MEVRFMKPLGRAWVRMSKILFEPFDLGKWIVLGLSAFLAGHVNGFRINFNLPFPVGDSTSGEKAKIVRDLVTGNGNSIPESIMSNLLPLILILVGIIFVLIFILGFAWIFARGTFIFLDNIAQNKAEIANGWRQYRKQGNSLFAWKILLSIIYFIILGVFILALFSMYNFNIYNFYDGFNSMPGNIAVVVFFSSLFFFFIILPFIYIFLFLNDFVTILMYKHDLAVGEALPLFIKAFKQRPLSFLLGYALFKWIIGLFWLILFLTFGIMTCCIGFVIGVLPLVGTILLLPAFTHNRLYSIEYLAQFGPEYALDQDME